MPGEIVEALGGNRPAVRVTVGGYTYRSSLARMRGEFKFPVSAAVRDQAGIKAGDEVGVAIDLDTQPREPAIPDDLAGALDRDPSARAAFERLSYSR